MEGWRIGAIASMIVFAAMFIVLKVSLDPSWVYDLERPVLFFLVVLSAASACRKGE